MATAELAVAMPVLVLVLAIALAALACGLDQIRCVDAARTGVRLLARGESAGEAESAARAAAPQGAGIVVADRGATVRMTVTGSPPPLLSWLGTVAIPRGSAEAAVEDELSDGAAQP